MITASSHIDVIKLVTKLIAYTLFYITIANNQIACVVEKDELSAIDTEDLNDALPLLWQCVTR